MWRFDNGLANRTVIAQWKYDVEREHNECDIRRCHQRPRHHGYGVGADVSHQLSPPGRATIGRHDIDTGDRDRGRHE